MRSTAVIHGDNFFYMLQYCIFRFTGHDQSKRELQIWIRPSLSLEYCLYINDRLAASKIDQETNILNEKEFSKTFSYDSVVSTYNELIDKFTKDGYQIKGGDWV